MELPAINAMRARRENCPVFPLCAPAKTGSSTIASFNAQHAILSVSPAHLPTSASLAIKLPTESITLPPKPVSAWKDISRPQLQSNIAPLVILAVRPVRVPAQIAPFVQPPTTEF